jgi:putative resolvase
VAPNVSDLDAKVVVVEHRDRLAGFGLKHPAAALYGQGRRVVVAVPGKRTDDLVRDVIEVLMSWCARGCGRRGARVMCALAATDHGSGEAR